MVSMIHQTAIHLNGNILKAPLFEQITQKLNEKMLNRDLNMQLVTSHFDKNSTLIPCAMIKQGIYEGSLIKNIIPD